MPTQANYATLKAYEQKLGGDDAAKQVSLNEEVIPSLVPLDSRDMLLWSSQAGRAARLLDAGVNTLLPDSIRTIAIVADRMITREDTILDLNKAEHMGAILALQAGGVLIQTDVDAIVGMATVNQSWAHQNGFQRGIRLRELQRARNS